MADPKETESEGTIERDHFRDAYAGAPPWDIGKPQAIFQAAADAIAGSVLDAGCGTGENALFLASRGRAVTGFDFLEEPIVLAWRDAKALRSADWLPLLW